MGWCPNCKNEFVEGISICPKCDVRLYDTLDEAELQARLMEEDENGQGSSSQDNNDMPKTYSMSANSSLAGSSVESASALNKGEETSDDEMDEQAKAEALAQQRRAMVSRRPSMAQVYQDKNVQAKDMKNSAYALIAVGILGLIFVALVLCDVIQLNQAPTFKKMFCGAISIMFGGFIVGGLLSIKSFKVIAKSASEEDQISAQIEKWYKEKLTVEKVESVVARFVAEDETEEEKYFYRIGCIKAVLTENFVNLDNAYVDHIVEDIYTYLYES